MTETSTETKVSALTQLDCRVRVAFRVLRAAPLLEQLTLAGMIATATAAAWPFDDSVYPFAAIPAVLLLTALIRLNADGLDDRRLALASAGAGHSDTRVITAVGPLAASSAGAAAGFAAAIAAGRPQACAHALLPLLVGVIAAIVLRPAWVGAPALGAASVAAAVASVVAVFSTRTGTPSALVASTTGAGAQQADAGWDYTFLPAVAAALVLVAAQVAVRRLSARGGRA